MAQEERISWHPGACSAIEIDLRKYKKHLEYIREFQLNKEPLRMDLLIIKKEPGVVIENDLGRIFSLYNIVEYKSPDDILSIDDFFKVMGYACLYKARGKKVDEKREEDITLTLIREKYPQKMVERLGKHCRIHQAYSGIYYVEGLLFPCQIVVTGQLDKEHSSLRILSGNAKREDVGNFLRQAENFDMEDKGNASSVLTVCTTANKTLFQCINKEEVDMCEAIRELFKDEIENGINMGIAENREDWLAEGKLKMLIDLVQKGLLSAKVAGEQAHMTEKEFDILLAKQ